MMMKSLVFVFVLIGIVASYSVDLRTEFEQWVANYNKIYAKEEKEQKYLVWKQNHERVKQYNEKKMYGTATFSLNEFSDMTPKEFKEQYASCYKSGRSEVAKKRSVHPTNGKINVPDSIDWRKLGAVTQVKNQGNCGSCWSFSTTGSLEGAHFIATNNLTSLSEQNLIDCSGSQNNDGCNGGRVDWALQYVIQNGGIDTEASYPYVGEDGTCNYNAANSGATCKAWTQTTEGDEVALQAQVAVQPVSIAISVDDAFANYASGVFVDDSCPNDADDLDHAVLIVGYGTQDGQDYWIVKNSWGASWGASGYILMARNHNNMCGVATDAVYPTV